jgi:hypothetical protein
VRREPEAIGTDDSARVHDAALADTAAVGHHHPRTDPRVGANARARTDAGQWPDAGGGIDDGTGVDHRTWMNTCSDAVSNPPDPPLRQAGVVQVRVGRDDGCAAMGGLFAQRGCHDDAACLRGRELCAIARVGEKADRVRRGRFQCRDALDDQTGVADALATQSGNDVGDGHAHRRGFKFAC